jgi:hypothetical protein
MKRLMIVALAIGLALGVSPALAQVSADRELLFLLDDEHQFLNIAQGTDPASIYGNGDLVYGIMGPADSASLFLLDDEHQFLNIARGTDVASIYADGGLVETIVAQSGEIVIDATAPFVVDGGSRWWEVRFPLADGVAALY